MPHDDGEQLGMLSSMAPVIRMHMHIERTDGTGWTVWVNRKRLWAARWEGGTTYPGMSFEELQQLLEDVTADLTGGSVRR